MPTDPADALLLETFGPQSLAYLVDADEPAIERRFKDGERLKRSSEEALRILVPVAERLAAERLDSPHFPPFSLEVLGATTPGQDHSFGNALRLAAGGLIDEPSDGVVKGADEVTTTLCRLARDAYPQLLAGNEARSWHGPRLMFFRHPLRERLQNAVMRDGQLSKMYPSEDAGLGRSGFVATSLGRGGTVQSVMFGETLVGAAWERALMVSASPTLPELYEAVSQSVETLRAALAGKDARVPVLLAFTGFATAGRSMRTPWGELRPMSDAERAASPPMLDGAVGGTDAAGRMVTVSYAGEMVLETTVPFQVVGGPWDPTDPESSSGLMERLTTTDAVRRRSDAIQLAVLLAADRPPGQWATARLTWQWTADPTYQARSMGWNDPRSSPGFMPTELSAAECDEVAFWCRQIDTHCPRRIDIAVRRTLSAAQVRTDASDRLVDAVVAWENLFGTSEGEPRLRVSAAMAWLLTDTPDRRLELQAEIKRLYDDRSKIVHGGTFDEHSIADRANRALELARDCLRVLLRHRTDVLALPDGSARSLKLILGG